MLLKRVLSYFPRLVAKCQKVFFNEMARYVMVIGLAYPNITDLEIREKMAPTDRSDNAVSGQAYYQNIDTESSHYATRDLHSFLYVHMVKLPIWACS